MGESDQEPDPTKRVPTILWMALGLIVAALFAAVMALHGHPGGKTVYAPPAGSPPAH